MSALSFAPRHGDRIDTALLKSRAFYFFAFAQAVLGGLFYFYLVACHLRPTFEQNLEVIIAAGLIVLLAFARRVRFMDAWWLEKDAVTAAEALKYGNVIVLPFTIIGLLIYGLKRLVDHYGDKLIQKML